MIYQYTPYKKLMFPYYEDKVTKLDKKDPQFSSQVFHNVRKTSSRKKILQSFGRLGLCMNDLSPFCFHKKDLTKVCFLIINDYYKEPKDLCNGPLNDGYLIGLNHYRHGYKIYYLYNSLRDKFTSFLDFFIENTTTALTVYYTGRDKGGQGIQFTDSLLVKSYINEIIASKAKKTLPVIFIDDTVGKGSVFDIKNGGQNMVALSVNKKKPVDPKENKRLHGIFTFFFCKITYQFPGISLVGLVEKMEQELKRFDEVLLCQAINKNAIRAPIFP